MLANTIIMILGIGITVMAIVFIIMCITSLIDAFSNKESKEQRDVKFRVNEKALKGSL